MEIIVALAMKFWQWSILIAVVIIGAIINFTDKRAKPKLKFNYKGMPHIKPLPIKTKGKGFWKAIVMWLLSTRNWELTQDWKYNIDGTEYVIPKGFGPDVVRQVSKKIKESTLYKHMVDRKIIKD